LAQIQAVPINVPSTDKFTPMIAPPWVWVHTEPESITSAGPSLSALKLAVIGSGPFSFIIVCASAILFSLFCFVIEAS